MSYGGIVIYIFLVILVIIIAILFTIGIDNLARLPDSTNIVNNMILDTVIGVGSFVVIFLIFLIAVGLIAAILSYYSTVVSNSYTLYAAITFTIATFGLIFLEIYFYTEFKLYAPVTDDIDIINSSTSDFQWGIGLTIFVFILSLIALVIIWIDYNIPYNILS